jgi:hypothetical protein
MLVVCALNERALPAPAVIRTLESELTSPAKSMATHANTPESVRAVVAAVASGTG